MLQNRETPISQASRQQLTQAKPRKYNIISGVHCSIKSINAEKCSTLPPSGIIIIITKVVQQIIIRMQSFYLLSLLYSPA